MGEWVRGDVNSKLHSQVSFVYEELNASFNMYSTHSMPSSMPNSTLFSKTSFFQKLALFSATDNPKCYCIPDLSVPKNCYCLSKTLQLENGTWEGGTGWGHF